MIEIEIEDEAWSSALPDVEALVLQAAEAALQQSSPGGGGGPLGERWRGLPPPATLDGKPATDPQRSSLNRSGGVNPLHHAPHGPPPPPGEVSIVVLLTSDEEVATLNHDFRAKPGPTNVLSFPAPPNPEDHLGDIALAYGVCAREAGEQGKTLAAHLQHLVAHGVLHLLGYDHQTEAEAEAMEALERAILQGIGVADPYA
jgi:probable rRNA maturation factor